LWFTEIILPDIFIPHTNVVQDILFG